MSVSFDRVPPVWTQTRFNNFLNDVETWINSGSAPANFVYPFSFIILTDGTYFTAYNSVGLAVYGGAANLGSVTGTDSSAVIQAAINATPITTPTRGNIIQFGPGYFYGNDIDPKAYMTFKGVASRSSFSSGTVLFPETDNCAVFKFDQTEAMPSDVTKRRSVLHFETLRFNGDHTGTKALDAHYAHHVTIKDCTFAGFPSNAILAECCWEWTVKDNYLLENGTLADPLDTAVIKFLPGQADDATNCNGWNIDGNIFGRNLATCIYGADDDEKGPVAYAYHNANWITNNWFHGETTDATRPDCYAALTGNFAETHIIGNNFVYSNQGFLKFGTQGYGNIIIGNEFSNLTGYCIFFDTQDAPAAPTTPRSGYHVVANNVARYNLVAESGSPTDGIVYFDGDGLNCTNNNVYCASVAVSTPMPFVKKGVNAANVKVKQYMLNRNGTVYNSERSGSYTITNPDNSVNVDVYLTSTPTFYAVTPNGYGPTNGMWVSFASNEFITVACSPAPGTTFSGKYFVECDESV